MATTEKRIAATIQQIIETENKTVYELSKETGIAYNTLKRRVATGRDIKVEELDAIAEALGIDALDLLSGPKDTQENPQNDLVDQRAAA